MRPTESSLAKARQFAINWYTKPGTCRDFESLCQQYPSEVDDFNAMATQLAALLDAERKAALKEAADRCYKKAVYWNAKHQMSGVSRYSHQATAATELTEAIEALAAGKGK